MISEIKEKYGWILKIVICIAAWTALAVSIYLAVSKIIDKKAGY